MNNIDNHGLNGTLVNEPKLVRNDPPAIVFKVQYNEQVLNCFMTRHALNFLYEGHPGDKIALYGHINEHHQFVVQKALVQPRLELF